MASQAIIANQRSLGGGGGSGIKINASVLPVLPSTATDGMIIVVSLNPANKFYFGYTMPPSPVAGDVWIQTIDTALGYPFLIGTVTLKPGATMQYTGSEWEYRNAYLGLGGKWEIFSTFSPLSALTWEQISTLSKTGGDMSKFFSTSDTKTITYNAVDYDVRPIGFNHDDLADGSGKAGLTFNFVDCIGKYQMNTGNTNNTSWLDSALRARSQEIFNTLPTDVTSAIKKVKKRTSEGNGRSTIVETEDLLFAPSEIEVFSGITNSLAGEGSQYVGFSTVDERKKILDGSTTLWWTRSPVKSTGVNYVVVTKTGESASWAAGNVYGFSPCFCI